MTKYTEESLGLSDSVPSDQDIPQDPVSQVSVSATEAQELAKQSLDFLAALALPLVFRYVFPPVFKAIWTWLLSYIHRERDFSQLAIGLPRGFAKTTFIKIFLLYVILFTRRSFILVCANSLPKAIAIISDVCDFLDEPNVRALFGDWRVGIETDQQVLKKFGFRGRTIILAAGTVESVRGLNVKHQRPDVMVFDDIQSRQDADSETVSQQIETDLYGTAMKAKSPHGCLFIFVGNMYPTKWSLLRRIKQNPTWVKFIAGGLLQREDGSVESLWEDLQPKEQLLKEFANDQQSGRPEVFFAEVLNDENASVNLLIDTSKIPQCPYEDDFPSSQHQGNYIIIDPSGDKVNSDAVSLGYFEIWDEKPVCREIVEGRLSPGDTIKEALKLCFKWNCTLVAVESNAYQYSLLYWSGVICAQMGIIGINFVDIYSGKRSKNARILDMFKALLAGETYLSSECRAQVTSQIKSFNPTKTNNVDGILDLVTYAPKVIELYGEYIASQLTLNIQDVNAIPVRSELETSEF
jgi:hypothetical protein